MLSQHFGAHLGQLLGAFQPLPPTGPLVRLRGRLAVTGSLIGALAQTNVLVGRLQIAGDDVIDIIGPVSVFQGDTIDLVLIVTDDAGNPVSLTGSTIEVQVKTAIGAADPPMIAKTIGSGITLLDQGDPATEGSAAIAFTSSDTSVTPTAYAVDAVVVLNGKRQHVVAPRVFNVLPVVNQA
jgi:hypothetical protein